MEKTIYEDEKTIITERPIFDENNEECGIFRFTRSKYLTVTITEPASE